MRDKNGKLTDETVTRRLRERRGGLGFWAAYDASPYHKLRRSALLAAKAIAEGGRQDG